jgi:hypothetical protein
MFTKVAAGLPYDPWCADCAYDLVRWAGIGAVATHAFDSAAAEEQMKAVIARGRN